MSKYSVGDVVTVRSDLKEGKKYGNDIFVSQMNHLLGEQVVITEVITFQSEYAPGYKYKIDGNHYNWTDEMFEDESVCEPTSLDVSDIL